VLLKVIANGVSFSSHHCWLTASSENYCPVSMVAVECYLKSCVDSESKLFETMEKYNLCIESDWNNVGSLSRNRKHLRKTKGVKNGGYQTTRVGCFSWLKRLFFKKVSTMPRISKERVNSC
jgi:hypothetical protein